MAFVSVALVDGRRQRALTVVDALLTVALAIDVDQDVEGKQVVTVVTRIAAPRSGTRAIRVDDRSKFISKALDRWTYEDGVTLDFSRPGQPTDNALVEVFNGRLRDERLNAGGFVSLAHARGKLEAWGRAYNESRFHRSLA